MSKERVIVLTESTPGGADAALLKNVIKHHKLFEKTGYKIIYGRGHGGIDDVMSRLEDLGIDPDFTSPGDKPSALLVVVDADENAKSRYAEVVKNIDKEKFSIGKKISEFGADGAKTRTGIFLFPNSRDSGSLETLCYEAIQSQDGMDAKKQCIESYLECLKRKSVDQSMTANNISKAKFRILNATPNPDRFVDSVVKNLDLSSSAFDPLVRFLKSAIQ